MTVTQQPTTIDGHPAIQFEYRVDDLAGCEAGQVAAFHPEDLADDNSWSLVPGELQRMYVVQMDPSTTFLLWYQGNSETEQQVIDSVRFIDTLPTP